MSHVQDVYHLLSIRCTKAHSRASDYFVDVRFTAMPVVSVLVTQLKHVGIFLADLGSTLVVSMLN